ncbi:MAG: FMN-binding protein [Oscillospiraceae bacterium]
MQRLCKTLLVLLCIVTLAACNAPPTYQDGTYSAEFKDFDSYGYKEYMIVTVSGGEITDLVYNAVNEEGVLRTQDEKYQQNMESVVDTYPEKYTGDLINQFMDEQDISRVDIIAGATWSSESFKALFIALEAHMTSGDTTALRVDNVPEK